MGRRSNRVHEQVRACLGWRSVKLLLCTICAAFFHLFLGFLLLEDINPLPDPFIIKQVLHLLEQLLLAILKALLITQEMTRNVALVLELRVFFLLATGLLVEHLLLLLDGVQTDPWDFDRELFKRSIVFFTCSVLLEDLIDEKLDRNALDAAFFFALGARVKLLARFNGAFRLAVALLSKQVDTWQLGDVDAVAALHHFHLLAQGHALRGGHVQSESMRQSRLRWYFESGRYLFVPLGF